MTFEEAMKAVGDYMNSGIISQEEAMQQIIDMPQIETKSMYYETDLQKLQRENDVLKTELHNATQKLRQLEERLIRR